MEAARQDCLRSLEIELIGVMVRLVQESENGRTKMISL